MPAFGSAQYGSFANPEKSVLATNGNETYVVYFYDESLGTGTLTGMDDAKAYSAQWFNPRTGKYFAISDSVVPVDGSWVIPEKQNADDWVLLVK